MATKRDHPFQPGDKVTIPTHAGLHGEIVGERSEAPDGERLYHVRVPGGGGLMRESELAPDTTPTEPTTPTENG